MRVGSHATFDLTPGQCSGFLDRIEEWDLPPRNFHFSLVTGGKMIGELATQALGPGLAVFSANMHPVKSGFHIQVELDGLSHPQGAVSVGDCEEFSKRLSNLIDEAVERQEPGVPAGFTAENYTLEVSSAGAERELRLPQDLLRFKEVPIKLRYEEDGKEDTAIVTSAGKGEDGLYLFLAFKGRRKQRKQKFKELRLEESKIRKANLFLDF